MKDTKNLTSVEVIKNLLKCPIMELYKFFPIIFDHCLYLICTLNDQIFVGNIFTTFVKIILLLQKDNKTEIKSSLKNYAREFHSKPEILKLCKVIPILFYESYKKDSEIIKTAWFLFEIVSEILFELSGNSEVDEKDLKAISYEIRIFTEIVSKEIRKRDEEDIQFGSELNHNLAQFLCDIVRIVDKYSVFHSV